MSSESSRTVGDGCSFTLHHSVFMIHFVAKMSCGTCHFTCDMTMKELVSFSRAIARRNVMRFEREMKRRGVWNGGLPTSAEDDVRLRGELYRPNMYVYFHAYIEAMRRGDVPSARCHCCYRLVDLDGVSVEDGAFRCQRCRRHHVRQLRKAMQIDDGGATRCSTEEGQER